MTKGKKMDQKEETTAEEEVKSAENEETISPQDTAEDLQAQIEQQKQRNTLLLADMENARKRMQREKADVNRFAVENVVTDFLGPIDQMEKALSAAENMSGEVKNWAMGFEMILSQFKEVIAQNGITAFESEGRIFDPHKHEALETEETEKHPHGYILKEFVKGYKSGDRIVRAARVKIAKTPMPKEELQENKQEEKGENND